MLFETSGRFQVKRLYIIYRYTSVERFVIISVFLKSQNSFQFLIEINIAMLYSYNYNYYCFVFEILQNVQIEIINVRTMYYNRYQLKYS